MSARAEILVVDDEPLIRETLAEYLTQEGFAVATRPDGESALALARERRFDVALCDVQLPGIDGLALLQKLQQLNPETFVLLITAYATVENAVEAFQRGAHDYLMKPILFDEVLAKLKRLLEHRELFRENQWLRRELSRQTDPEQMVGRGPAMRRVLELARKVAPTRSTVLLTGESGTGKELFARAIHELSPRRDQPFVVVDCGAIPTTLIESELFGHEKGAFTGAQRREPGRLLQADRGTVLLDEIGELPLEAQSRLLRFVQDRHVTPVGGRAGRTVDVRVVAATNRDLAAEVEAGRFRADLYHRLNVVRLDIPALRDRPDDVRHLADHFCKTYSLIYGGPAGSFSAEAKAAVLRHDWPGNVRELQNRVMRAVILGQGSTITPADLGFAEEAPAGAGREEPPAGSIAPEPAAGPAQSEADPWERLRGALRQQIEQALAGRRPVAPLGRWLMNDLVQEADAAAGSVASRAAAILGTPLTTFRRRLEGSVAPAGAG
jgi:DNA-binding NtrC family response regulator